MLRLSDTELDHVQQSYFNIRNQWPDQTPPPFPIPTIDPSPIADSTATSHAPPLVAEPPVASGSASATPMAGPSTERPSGAASSASQPPLPTCQSDLPDTAAGQPRKHRRKNRGNNKARAASKVAHSKKVWEKKAAAAAARAHLPKDHGIHGPVKPHVSTQPFFGMLYGLTCLLHRSVMPLCPPPKRYQRVLYVRIYLIKRPPGCLSTQLRPWEIWDRMLGRSFSVPLARASAHASSICSPRATPTLARKRMGESIFSTVYHSPLLTFYQTRCLSNRPERPRFFCSGAASQWTWPYG